MRVTKKGGRYVVEDQPLRLKGEAAEKFLSSMNDRDARASDPQRARFLEECAATYRAKR